MGSTNRALLILTAIVLISRIFFLDAGYGSEEDAWGVGLTAKHMAQSGTYEASRLPGHPVQEYFYAAIINNVSIYILNGITAIFSLVACLYFYLILEKLKFKHSFIGALTLAFTPIIYMHSTDCMDYVWALGFIMMSYYWLIHDRFIIAGILLAFAVGCRITSAVFFIPYVLQLYLYKKALWNNLCKLSLPLLLLSCLFYFPVYHKYGPGFFHYYDQFPYPSFSKVIFKETIGIWGTIGYFGLLFFLLIVLINVIRNKTYKVFINGLSKVWFLIIVLYTALYFMLPQKSAYFIPVIPFVILLAAQYLNKISFYVFSCSILVSSYFLGINLGDKTRGAEPSRLNINMVMSGQIVHLDFLHGPVIDDYLKRKSRMDFTDEIIKKAALINVKSVIISGWWLNPVLNQLVPLNKWNKINFVYCIREEEMHDFIKHGYSIYYLPEMDSINDIRYKICTTKSLAKPLF